MKNYKYILSIAGFDPSGGAGIVSDIKTFEAHNLYGLSVCTAVTVQNDINFKTSYWIPIKIITNQIETLFERFNIGVVKIGLVKNWKTLFSIVQTLHGLNSKIKIIVDPILKASSGFDFHSKDDFIILDSILDRIYLITPNYEEIQNLFPEKSIEDTIKYICSKTNLYLKGGHRTQKKGWDELYLKNSIRISIQPEANEVHQKHGSGCVLSSSLAANLCLENTIENSSRLSKKYIETFLNSNTSLLGNHLINN